MKCKSGYLLIGLVCLAWVVAGVGIAHGQEMENFDLLGQVGGSFKTFVVSNNKVFFIEGSSLVIVDVSDPAQPIELSRRRLEFDATPGPISTAGGDYPDYLGYILSYGQYLYVTTTDRGLQIYNVSDSRAPVYAGRLAAYDTYQPQSLTIDGNRLYFGGNSLHVFDLTRPTTPTEIANLPYVSGKMAVNQGRALLTVGPLYSGYGSQGPLKVYDLRDTSHPVYLGELDYSHPTESANYHYAVAMQWPKIAVVNSWTYWGHCGIPPLPCTRTAYGLNLYTHTSGTSWTRVQGNTFEADLTIALGSNALFVQPPGYVSPFDAIRAYDTNTLQEVGVGPRMKCDFLFAEGNRLYALNSGKMDILDVSSPANISSLGSWDSLGGSVVAVGNGRAYVFGEGKHILVADVRNPFALRPTGRGPIVGAPHEAAVVGRSLYVVDASAGLFVYSLANPDRPEEVLMLCPIYDQYTGESLDFEIAGNRAYVAMTNQLLRIFDVTDPTSPVALGGLPYGSYGGSARAVTVVGDYAYLLSGNTILMVNVHYPDAPWPVGSYAVLGDMRDLAALGNCLFVLASPSYGSSNSSAIVDVSNPTSPTKIANFGDGGRMAFGSGSLFVLAGDLRAFNVSNPHNPWEAGWIAAGFDNLATSGTQVYGISPNLGLWVAEFTQPQPIDLLPNNFALAAPGSAPGEPIDFLGSVQNLGPAATTQSFWVAFAGIPTDRTGPALSLCDSFLVPAGLASNGAVTLAGLGKTLYGPDRGILPGKYQVAIVVDQPNEIVETREHNNIALAPGEFTVWPSLNDLRPVALSYSPTIVGGGSSITLSGQVEYTGTRATTKGFWAEFWCSRNADFSPPRYLLCDSLFVGPGLTPGTLCPFTITRTVRSPAQDLPIGSYVVALWVDRIDNILERDEANNTYWRSTQRLSIKDSRSNASHWEMYR